MNGKSLAFHVKYFDHGSYIPTVMAALLLILRATANLEGMI